RRGFRLALRDLQHPPSIASRRGAHGHRQGDRSPGQHRGRQDDLHLRLRVGRMRPRSPRGVAFTLLAAALLSACTSSPPEDGGAVAPSDYGGRFVYPLRTEPATLNFVTA